MLLKSIKLSNFLSYGGQADTVPLEPLNVIIGPNGSGKSNLIEAIDLIRSAPTDLLRPIRDGGGVRDWLWKGSHQTPVAGLDVVFEYPKGSADLRYGLDFTEVAQRFEIVEESIHYVRAETNRRGVPACYAFKNGRASISLAGKLHPLQPEEIVATASILAQIKDPLQYPELTYLGNVFSRIRLYREWTFGRYAIPRLPQKADLPNEYLESDASNLGLVLNRLRRDPAVKQRLLSALRVLYDGIDDYDVQIEGGTVQVYFHEGRFPIPATRLSDGTLRYLCLLAILCHPNPPPLVCIEEPELGLHPDVLPTLADLLKEASERSQLIVTTHSDVLVDAMSDRPQAVLVAERDPERGTTLTRLEAEQLAPWLEKYRLGQLWTRGDIGGTRW